MPPVQLSAVASISPLSCAFSRRRRAASSVSLGSTSERVSVSFMTPRNRAAAPMVPQQTRKGTWIMVADKKLDATQLLTRDHREVEALFEKFEKASGDGAKEKLARQICTELKIHTMIEEELFYPALRGKIDDDDLDEAIVEHDGAKVLINDIEAAEPSDDYYDAKVKVLQEEIEHHVKEEEKQKDNMFSQARKTDVDLDALGERMAQRKAELQRIAETEGLPPAKTAALTEDAA